MKKNPALLICCLLSAAMMGYIYFDGISILVRQWLRLDEFWRFLIIPVSIYFVWIKRKAFSISSIRPSFIIGIPLILVGCASFILWKISLVDFFIELGLFILSFGFIALFLGKHYIKVFIFPLFYLMFMTSILVRILSPLSFFMQYISSACASFFLNLFGWPVLHDGLLLRLPHVVLEVAPACSGINQLIALIAFALPIGVLRHKSFWPRAVLAVMTIPITLISNAMRIILIAIWNYNGLQSFVHGPHGILDLPLIYPLALICLYACSLLLSRFENKTTPLSSKQSEKHHFTVQPASKRLSWYICFLLMAMTIGATFYFQTKPVVYKNNLDEFPLHFNNWNGREISDNRVTFYMGKPDAMIQRKYTTNEGMEVALTIARFNRQNTGKRMTSIESALFNGTSDPIEIAIDTATTIKANSIETIIDNQRITTYKWFDIDGISCGSITALRKQYILNSLLKKRNNGAIIAFSVNSYDTKKGRDVLTLFIKEIFPSIARILQTHG